MDTEQRNRATIFLIEEDDETRPLLRRNLTRDGFRVLMAIDEDDAISRVDDGHLKADLVLINLVGRSVEDTLQIGRRIREHGKSDGATPLVVLADKYEKDVEGTNVNVGGNDWILYLGEDLDQLQNLLHSLLDQPSN
ncbi:MAG TPA: hypothetical protein VJ842_01820 [Pyrinomonadaceae bacterium]|nr:hypothetical protein [Pyrinomonadaceae bacterium]